MEALYDLIKKLSADYNKTLVAAEIQNLQGETLMKGEATGRKDANGVTFHCDSAPIENPEGDVFLKIQDHRFRVRGLERCEAGMTIHYHGQIVAE